MPAAKARSPSLISATAIPRWDADLVWSESDWRDSDWQATPAPAPPTTAKLIPIVATAEVGDAATLARTYFQRWPLQENVIRDYLIPLGIDTNHGYAKREVVNSEVAKRRTALEGRLAKLKRWAERAGERTTRASLRYHRLWEQAKLRARAVSNELFKRQLFKLAGQVEWEAESVRVRLRPFNDRQMNRDLAMLCARVAAVAPHLPDGRRLVFIHRCDASSHSRCLSAADGLRP